MEWGNLEEEPPKEEIWLFTQESKIVDLFEKEAFEYFEEHGTNEELALFLDFIQAYLDDDKTHHWTYPIDFAVQEKRIDFVNLMVPTPINFEECFEDGGPDISLMRTAVLNGDIEMVKLLMKYSKEKCIKVNVSYFDYDRLVSESLQEVAIRLGHHKVAQFLKVVNEGCIDVTDLKPRIRNFL